MKVDILGKEYEIIKVSKRDEHKYPKLEECNGYCELWSKQIIVATEFSQDKMNNENLDLYIEKVLRHEIVHAFFFESGLRDYCENEQLVDWIAMQLPKMQEVINSIKGK